MDPLSSLVLSPVQEFYQNKCIFITGASGFVGKTIVEKLLRACWDLDRIYILLRPKRNLSVELRFDKLLQSSVFDTLRKTNPSFAHKITPIVGDITLPALGISPQDAILLKENVHIVFHSAATVKFNEMLKVAMDINFHGTKKVLELCKEMRQLRALIHISTAYTNPERAEVDEIIYPLMSEMAINKLVLEIEGMDEKTLETMTPVILQQKPNTYAFTKALVESYLEFHKDILPISIIRPSIVTAAVNEPAVGWIDNLNAASGLIVFAGKGLLRSLLVNGRKRIDFIPVDFLANLAIVGGWKTTVQRSTLASNGSTSSSITVYNSCAKNPILYSDFARLILSAAATNPFDDVIWFPTMTFTESRWMSWFQDAVFHRIPAYCIDYCSFTSRGKRKMSMVRVYKKMRESVSALEYFMNRDWKFYRNNVETLQRELAPKDQVLFPMFVYDIKWPVYLINYVIGLRKYTLLEEDKNIPIAKQNIKRKFFLHLSVKCLLCVPILLLLYMVFHSLDLIL